MFKSLSFLDIEYAWVNSNQIVFFIPEKQYTQENIKKFNSIKINNSYLAIAIDGYETSQKNINEHNLSFYQHGYYDLLMNDDYEILPFKRQYYSNRIKNNLTEEEFKQKFAFNDRRIKLYKDYLKVINIIKQNIKLVRVKIAGSYVEDKEYPNDLDLIITINDEELKRINTDKVLYQKFGLLISKTSMEKLGFDIHCKVLVEKKLDLTKCDFTSNDDNVDYLCSRGYYVALYSQKTIYHKEGYDCYIRNMVRII